MIVVNARFLTQAMTGTQRYGIELSRELKRRAYPARFVCPRGVVHVGAAAELGAEVVGRFGGHFWEQVELPAFLTRNGRPLLVNLINSAPLGYPNKISACHDISFVRHPASFPPLYRAVYALLTPLMLATSRRVVTVSRFSRDEIALRFGVPLEKLAVIPSAPSPVLKAAAAGRPAGGRPERERPYFLAVSSVLPHKNFRRLLLAWEGLERDVDLLIVGDLNARHAAVWGPAVRQPGVRFLGRIGDDELIELYRGALAFVHPSLYEGFGLTPLEAQTFGCPVALARAASLPEVYGESALYFDPTDLADMRLALRRLADEPELRRSLSEAGSANAARYSFGRSADLFIELMESLDQRG